MTAAYPEAHTEFDNAKADEDMAFLIEIIKLSGPSGWK